MFMLKKLLWLVSFSFFPSFCQCTSVHYNKIKIQVIFVKNRTAEAVRQLGHMAINYALKSSDCIIIDSHLQGSTGD